jgi:xanthine dehydrogenase accessory factor
MKEIKSIISAYDKILNSNTGAALATVVRVEGSSYRREGARMLVMDDGLWIGGISGGCLEGDALKRARLAISKSEPSLVTYDTTEDDSHQIGVGLGCNGIIDVLFTPLDFKNKNNPIEVLKNAVGLGRQTNILITITGLKGNWQNLKMGDIIPYKGFEDISMFGDSIVEKDAVKKINQLITAKKSGPLHFLSSAGKELSLFVELLLPEIQLILMGHQYDIYPLVCMVREAGWEAKIIANPLKVNPKIISLGARVYGTDQLNELSTEGNTAILLMSHDFKTDKLNLPQALRTKASYIGMLGPRVRAEKIFRELGEEGSPITDEDKDRIYAPAGLDIGALSPEEIAISLVAEIRAVFSKREGGFLRLRQNTIHQRD